MKNSFAWATFGLVLLYCGRVKEGTTEAPPKRQKDANSAPISAAMKRRRMN